MLLVGLRKSRTFRISRDCEILPKNLAWLLRDLRDLLSIGNLAPLSINFAQKLQTLHKKSTMKLIWSPLVEKIHFLKHDKIYGFDNEISNVSLQRKNLDFRVLIYIFAFRKCLLLILHFENRQFDPKKAEYFSIVIGTEI